MSLAFQSVERGSVDPAMQWMPTSLCAGPGMNTPGMKACGDASDPMCTMGDEKNERNESDESDERKFMSIFQGFATWTALTRLLSFE